MMILGGVVAIIILVLLISFLGMIRGFSWTKQESEEQTSLERMKTESLRETKEEAYRERLKNELMEFMADHTKETLKTLQDHVMSSATIQNMHQKEQWSHISAPMLMRLQDLDKTVTELHQAHIKTRQQWEHHMGTLSEVQHKIVNNTTTLIQTLKTPQEKGTWGEMHLRRVLELAGLAAHVDFSEQSSWRTEDQKLIRPDVIVTLPDNRRIVIDAKVPWVDEMVSKDSEILEAAKGNRLKPITSASWSKRLRDHIKLLSDKQYPTHIPESFDCVVLFLPHEGAMGHALLEDPELLNYAYSRQVILATPMTLLGLLRAVTWGWKQSQRSVNAEHMARIGAQVFESLVDLTEHHRTLGQKLSETVKSYHHTTQRIKEQVWTRAKTLAELGAGDEKNLEVKPILMPILDVR
jgi:DNA recombination protein RmuC